MKLETLLKVIDDAADIAIVNHTTLDIEYMGPRELLSLGAFVKYRTWNVEKIFNGTPGDIVIEISK